MNNLKRNSFWVVAVVCLMSLASCGSATNCKSSCNNSKSFFSGRSNSCQKSKKCPNKSCSSCCSASFTQGCYTTLNEQS